MLFLSSSLFSNFAGVEEGKECGGWKMVVHNILKNNVL